MRYFRGFSGIVMSYVLVVLLWIARTLRLFKAINLEKAEQAIARGSVLFICNHPSLLETIAIPSLFWPYPWQEKTRQVPYSVADINLFPLKWQIAFRLLVVSRDNTTEAAAINKKLLLNFRHILKDEGVVIFYPEGGRTYKGECFVEEKDRKVRVPKHELVALATKWNTTIIPVWADHGDCSKERGLWKSYWLLFTGRRMTIQFGKPLTGEITPESVALALLRAGRETG